MSEGLDGVEVIDEDDGRNGVNEGQGEESGYCDGEGGEGNVKEEFTATATLNWCVHIKAKYNKQCECYYGYHYKNDCNEVIYIFC